MIEQFGIVRLTDDLVEAGVSAGRTVFLGGVRADQVDIAIVVIRGGYGRHKWPRSTQGPAGARSVQDRKLRR